MSQLEPTYLRYIYDGLIKGSIHPENAAELPEGLIGLYEEAFDERTSVMERQKLLQRFAIWALLKKEVSAAFVAEVLGETEDDIQQFISTYSTRFNSPESGKYQLYHERLKVYLLQTLSGKEMHVLHEQLITRLEKAILDQKADEFELYSLEFLAVHLSVGAMLYGDVKKLVDLAYSKTHWERQLKISKGYFWTKNGLKAVMAWASKYNDSEVIECGLQLVDLHHQEQNGAPQIVALVAEGDFESALKRIEQFGGNDKEGLQRKFIVYMLCLIELTLLDSKDKPFQKEGLEKLLKHMDEQLPVDHSVLNWNDFFPSYLMFQMACEWAELGLDYLIAYKHTAEIENNWIEDIKISEFGINILLAISKKITNSASNGIDLNNMIIRTLYSGDVEAANSALVFFEDKTDKVNLLCRISAYLANQGKLGVAKHFLKKAFNIALSVKDLIPRSRLLGIIATYLAKQGRINDALKTMQDALDIANSINSIFQKHHTLNFLKRVLNLNGIISVEFIKVGNVVKALEYANNQSECFQSKIETIGKISTELVKQKQLKKSMSVLKDVILEISLINNKKDKEISVCSLSKELAIQNNFRLVADLMHSIIKREVIKIKTCDLDFSLDNLSNYAARIGKVDLALSLARFISDSSIRQEILIRISKELFAQQRVQEAKDVLNEAGIKKDQLQIEEMFVKSTNDISYELDEQQENVIELAQKGMVQEILEYANRIIDVEEKTELIKEISIELAKNGRYDLSEKVAFEIKRNDMRYNCWREMANEILRNYGYEKTIELLENFKSLEAKIHIRTRITQSMDRLIVQQFDLLISGEFSLRFAKYLRRDLEFLEHILCMNAIKEMFFGELSVVLLNRLQRTLNIQWAVDIKNQIN